ncbi:MAG TPA: hypothetical protein PKY59_20740 [Pyrinomonadaceae bacterium]|nr:hypothetical protein [Pyrinomonadaceae bacterium]
MLKSLILILFIFCSLCFAQTETSPPKPVAQKIDEFGTNFDGEVKMRMDNFQIALANDPSAIGYIINYGLPKEIAKRRKQLWKSIYFRKYDPQRITYIDGGFSPKINTEFWLVPSGAEPPTPQEFVEKINEFENATANVLKSPIDFFYIRLANDPELKGYVLNYGTTKQISVQERRIKKWIAFRRYDFSKITFIKAGTRKTIKTEFWIEKKTP